MSAVASSGGVDSARSPAFGGQGLPRQLGPYTLFEPLGRGGMAELYLARAETELGATRLAAVKVVLPALAGDPQLADMLVHEAKLAAGLSHRHIVSVLDLGSDPSGLYIAMEYVEGLDLNALLRLCSAQGEGLPAEHALGIVADVLDGLDYAHRAKNEAGIPLGIVHRDVSPSNVLISYEGEVKLCDFGIARANDLVLKTDDEDEVKGKAGYMSPEHAFGEALDARSDVFATGIILWELLAGRRLYRPKGDVPLLEQARRAEIPPLPDRGLPHAAELERIVRRALAFRREDRYPTAGAFQRDLEDYLASAGLLASRLKLGEWMASTFGTGHVEKRRASERALPKSSAPPPRPSSAVRMRTSAAMDVVIPSAPRVPSDLGDLRGLAAPPAPDSSGVAPGHRVVPTPPQSLEGDSMDVAASSASLIEGAGARDSRPSARDLTDAEIVAAIKLLKRRGPLALLAVFLLAFAATAGALLAWRILH
jgi:serine/threonine-protein kinase